MAECANTVGTRASSFGYDTGGNLTSMNNSASRTFNYSYDSAGQLQTESNTYNGSSPNITTPMLTSATYFATGQPSTMTTNTGTATLTGTWGVDNRLRSKSYVNQSTANSGYTNYGYSVGYTANSNVKNTTETAFTPGVGSQSWSWAYTYDTLSRLSISTSSGAIGYGCQDTYDAWGNRLAQAPYGAGNTCTAISTPALSNNRLSGYSYDGAGNLLYDGTNTLTYDAEGRIATSSSSANGTTTYVYGADGQRAGKIVGANETNYVHDLDGSLLVTYLNATYANMPEELWLSGKHFGTVSVPPGGGSQTETFSLTNWLGSETARTNPATGIPASAFLSQPYGDGQTTLFGTDSDDIHFTGKERDAESGNDYFGARYYASGLGRFMSPDPENAGANALNPQSWNMYNYAANNPLNNLDPNGKECVWDDGSYDSEDDPDSGSPGQCAGLGGTWYGHAVFANSQYSQGDWSANPNSALGQLTSRVNTCAASVGGGMDVSLLVADALISGYSADQLDYLMATAQHESGPNAIGQHMTEMGSGSYFKKYQGILGNDAQGDAAAYKGRGYIQITGKANYARWSSETGVNLVQQPSAAATPDIAAQIAVEGLQLGAFTGASLPSFVNQSQIDYFGARTTVNGHDRARQIAMLAEVYADAFGNNCN